jgi:hypothetical protein
MKRFLLLVLVVGCSNGPVGNTSPSDWNDAVNAYIQAACVDAAVCTGDDPDQCTSDVQTDMAQAKTMLDADGQAACVDCLNVKAEQAHAYSFTCDMADIDMDAIVAACGANDEACAGFP